MPVKTKPRPRPAPRRPAPRAPAPRLAPADWEEAALAAIASGGVEAVAIEPLAERLGVTKGSGYWHFTSREDLLRRALERWERRDTEGVIAALANIADPRRRLEELFRRAMRLPAGPSLYTALFAAAGHPVVGPVLARVATRRIEYLQGCFRELGLPAEAARHRALLAYATYVGLLHLGREAPGELPRGEAAARLAQRLDDLLLATDANDVTRPSPGGELAVGRVLPG